MSAAPRILLVEDDPEQASLFSQVLSLVGYHVEASHDAETALTRMAERAYELVLSDWDLPGLAGDAFITQVQQRYPGVKTVLFSNHASVDQAARACHADASMVKNEGIHLLRKIVAGLLSD